MTNLTQAELLALRAVLEVGEPSPDDAEPMEIWATAMTAMKKIEDEVEAAITLRNINNAVAGRSAPDPAWFETNPHIADTDLHTCTCAERDEKVGLCGLPAVAKYDDGINTPEYLCNQHYNETRSNSPDPDTDCGWSLL